MCILEQVADQGLMSETHKRTNADQKTIKVQEEIKLCDGGLLMRSCQTF